MCFLLWCSSKRRAERQRDRLEKRRERVRHIKRMEDMRSGFIRAYPIPELLPSVRPRALTPTPPAAAEQCDSLLLAKLPLEIRQLIYKYSLGGMTLHLSIRNTRLIHTLCLSSDPDMCEGECASEKRLRLLPLLLTCHQIYSEASYFLYSENTFAVLYRDVIQFLPRMILPQKANEIRSLRFKWHLVNNPPLYPPEGPSKYGPYFKYTTWIAVWNSLAELKGLRHLTVRFSVHAPLWEALSIEEAESLVQPIKAVKVSESFVLHLGFCNNTSAEAWNALPCEILSSARS